VDSELTALLRDLVGVPSMNPYRAAALEPGHGEAGMANRVAAFAQEAGLHSEIVEVAPGRPNVIVRLDGPEDVDPVLFVAHIDTVPVDGMTIEPFDGVVRDGRLYGRGACDNKGSVATILSAMKRVAARGDSPSPVLLACTADEECGFTGIRSFLKRPPRAQFGIVCEPTKLEIIIAHRGALRLIVTTRGKSAHSAHPEQGENAIYRMSPIVTALREFADALAARPEHPLVGGPRLSVGTIHGGHSVNTVPDQCVIEVDRRLLPEESPADAEREIRTLVAALGGTVEPASHIGSFEIAEDAPVVAAAREAVRAVTGSATTVGVGYGTEASEVHAAGIPCVVLGPGDGSKAHSDDEYIDLDQLEVCAKVYEHIMTGGEA
jgi:acetylornithine deacetylase